MMNLNVSNMFNGMFGKIEAGKCALTVSGGIAIKTSNGYKCYNLKKKRLTNVSNLCFDASDLFFVMPTSKVKIGDIILVGGKPKCVIGVAEEAIKVIDYENSEVREVVPERHIFMGSTYFYGKIVSLFGTVRKGKGFMGKIMNLMMMKMMFDGNKNSDDNSGFMGNFGQMLMMQQFFGGNKDGEGFENMFDLQFDDDISDLSDEDEDDDEEDTKSVAKSKKK